MTALTKILFTVVALTIILPASLNAQQKRRAVRARTTKAARATKAPLVEISAQDLTLMVASLNLSPEVLYDFEANKPRREAFIKNLAEAFAVAEEAKATGVAAAPEVKRQLALSSALVIAREYGKRRQAAGATTYEQVIPKEDVAAFLNEPGQDANFQTFLRDYESGLPPSSRAAPMPDVQRENLKRQWASVLVGNRKGLAAGVDRERATQLMIMEQHARVLTGVYFQKLGDGLKATEQEINAYLARHPELDPQKTRARAEDVLGRLRAGENFDALAKQFSADSSNRDRGGDLGWFGRGQMVPPFEDAAFALRPGELSGLVETQFGFHIIKVEERRTGTSTRGTSIEEVRARHILISAGAPGGGGRPQSPREQARVAVEVEKRDKVIDRLVKLSRVRIADDFVVGTPGTSPQSPVAPGATGSTDGGNAPTASPSSSSAADERNKKSPRPATVSRRTKRKS